MPHTDKCIKYFASWDMDEPSPECVIIFALVIEPDIGTAGLGGMPDYLTNFREAPE